MIQTFAKISLLASMLWLSGCGGDNAFTGTGVIGGGAIQSQNDAMASLQKEVFVTHAEGFASGLLGFKNILNTFDVNLTSTDISTLQEQYKTIMQEWKSVEASYVAADYDKNLIDTPQLIDFYHTGKKLDVAADIDNALNQTIAIEDALFKNSSKSMTALEYLIFGDNETVDALTIAMNINNKRRVDAMKVTVEYLETKASEIAVFYQKDSTFVADAESASNSIVNVLIDSSFKLKEWRLGEPSGIALKFKDDPDSTRFEYAKSKLSLDAIEAILRTHQEIMGVQSFANFGTFASANGAETVVAQIQTQLQNALSLVTQFGRPIEDAVNTTTIDPKIQTLYDTVKVLQELYFTSLIQALDLTAEIIEADGD